jgi:hypothetical protein
MNLYRSKDTATDATAVETGPTRLTRHIIVTGG